MFTIVMERQSYDRIYLIYVNNKNRKYRSYLVCYWNISEVKDGKLKIHYERQSKGIQSNNAT